MKLHFDKFIKDLSNKRKKDSHVKKRLGDVSPLSLSLHVSSPLRLAPPICFVKGFSKFTGERDSKENKKEESSSKAGMGFFCVH